MKDDVELEMYELQRKLWELLTPYTESNEGVMMSTAVLMKTAIQMYTVVMSDEDIERLLANYISASIPEIREQFQKQLTSTIH